MEIKTFKAKHRNQAPKKYRKQNNTATYRSMFNTSSSTYQVCKVFGALNFEDAKKSMQNIKSQFRVVN